MAKRDSPDSKSAEEEASSKDSSSGEEEGADSGDGTVRKSGLSDYERQRQSRITENRARMEALGLRKLASSLMVASPQCSMNKKRKGKKLKFAADDDDDYRPEDEQLPSSSSDKNDHEDDDVGDFEEFVVVGSDKRKSCAYKKVKNAASNPKKKTSVKKVSINSDYIDDDDDDALKMAIALSLQESGLSSSYVVSANANESTKGEKQGLDNSGKNKRKKPFTSRIQVTEEELLLHFYQFDENWNGGICVRDLERVAIAHDFTWTGKELVDMIRCFDTDDDGKLSFDDFRKILIRCKMIKGSEGQ